MFFPRTNRCSALLKCAQELITEYEKRNKHLEAENLRLFGLVVGLTCPLTGSPKEEVAPMNYEDERRAIELTDAAGRAINNALPDLAAKLSKQADKLLSADAGPAFEDWVAIRNYNIERFNGAFVSKMTQELYECWLAAGGSK